MSIWLAIWLLFSVALLFFMVWTLKILLAQKRAWRKYAQRYKLRYVSRQFMATPELSGTIDDLTVNIFSGEHITPDERNSRRLMAIEISLSSKMSVRGGVASAGMVQILKDMGMKEELRPEHKGWDKSYIAASDNRFVLEEYLTQERLQALTGLMKIKNVWVILVFQGDLMLLRLDTPDPLETPKKIDVLVKKMLAAAKVLELKAGESARLKSAEARSGKKETTLKVDEKTLGDKIGLELEEDDATGASPDSDGEQV